MKRPTPTPPPPPPVNVGIEQACNVGSRVGERRRVAFDTSDLPREATLTRGRLLFHTVAVPDRAAIESGGHVCRNFGEVAVIQCGHYPGSDEFCSITCLDVFPMLDNNGEPIFDEPGSYWELLDHYNRHVLDDVLDSEMILDHLPTRDQLTQVGAGVLATYQAAELMVFAAIAVAWIGQRRGWWR